MRSKQREEVFAAELALIEDVSIREFTKLCLALAPDYFFTDCPASSTGKYHPLNELAADGTILHTKKVFHIAYALTRALAIDSKRDAVLSGCIIHDLLKRGKERTSWTLKNHPRLAADLVSEVQRDTQLLDDDDFKIIHGSVYYHYGPWTTKAFAKPMTEYTLPELCVYISDYIASKRFLDVQYKDVVHD